MSVAHERDINWDDSLFTLPMDADFNGEPIRVVFEQNHMRNGGAYAVWHEREQRGAPVEDQLALSRAKQRAMELQRKYGSPIVEEVDVV